MRYERRQEKAKEQIEIYKKEIEQITVVIDNYTISKKETMEKIEEFKENPNAKREIDSLEKDLKDLKIALNNLEGKKWEYEQIITSNEEEIKFLSRERENLQIMIEREMKERKRISNLRNTLRKRNKRNRN